ncbi:DUF2271 domain-containing protein [Undibacterium oligocarboniphilum]|uniref:DUF2271 domain-containing protein n=1 Tax=Undibacterium oligocarboniphilum TaxID=666702 RepID=A0A850QC29_9BURK|nr:DUF2271 domain-containing protein [Undibacterium oligocarboniphilum]MBC3869574.1 DUF2271 domain-containing protein [Undibacterium oligocarboniphilum]NVO77952.1 DUF2271 domain-containing protein [Undibacterium oligocarboniphilum]
MRNLLPFAISGLLGTATMNTLAADLTVRVEVPRLNVAEYHKPYVAIWIEKPDQTFAGNLAVWYDLKKRDNEGSKWLKDLRQWWRRSGRELQMPVDGLSGATRTTGEHSMVFSGDKGVLAKLPAGDYQLLVEAAREGGGREVVKVPFQWQAKNEINAKAQGNTELGQISVTVK